MEQSLLTRIIALLSSNILVVLLQTVQFVLLARILGAGHYGSLVAIQALTAVVTPLSGLGYGSVMLLNVSRDRSSENVHIGNSLVAVWFSGTVLCAIVVLCAGQLYSNTNSQLALAIAFTDLLIIRSCSVFGQYYQAVDLISKLSILNVSIVLARLLALTFLLFKNVPQPIDWAMGSLVILLLVSTYHFLDCKRRIGFISCDFQLLRRNVGEALQYSLGTTARATYSDLDKIYLGKFSGHEQLGLYTAAYRVISMSFMPIRAVLDVLAARYFRAGERGITHTIALTRGVMRFTVPYGVLIGAAIYIAAPYVQLVLGHSFAGTTEILRFLCLLPPVQAIHYAFSDALTGAGKQALRTKLQFITIAIYVALAQFLIPRYDWKGAAATSILSESILAVLVALACRYHLGRQNENSTTNT